MPAAISTSSMMPFSGSIKKARLLIGGLGGTTFSRVPELASLAVFLRTQGLEEDEDLIRSMQEHFGLGRLATSTRQRFEAAILADEK
jgi:hypothetical protein